MGFHGHIGMPLYDDPSADEPYAMTANGPVYFRGTMATDGDGETTVQIAPEADSAPSEPPLDVSPAKDEIAAEQVAFKKFLSKRVKAGKWRDFEFVYVAPDLAEQLNEQGRTLVKGTDTPKAPGATRPHFSELPGHDAKQEIADYYVPIIRKALAVTGVAQAITQAMSALKAAEDKVPAQQAVTHNVKMDKEALLKAVRDLYGDAGLRGTKLAMDQLGGAAKLGSGINGLVGGINWDKWTPGHPEAAGTGGGAGPGSDPGRGGPAQGADRTAEGARGRSGTPARPAANWRPRYNPRCWGPSRRETAPA